MAAPISIDIRVLFAEELAELLTACAQLIARNPEHPGVLDLIAACERFTGQEPFEVPELRRSRN